jgi:hypothetical protein
MANQAIVLGAGAVAVGGIIFLLKKAQATEKWLSNPFFSWFPTTSELALLIDVTNPRTFITSGVLHISATLEGSGLIDSEVRPISLLAPEATQDVGVVFAVPTSLGIVSGDVLTATWSLFLTANPTTPVQIVSLSITVP